MCELLGLTFNKEINPVFSFVGLLSEADYHCHGWGLSFYPNNGKAAAVFKEATAGCNSELAPFLASYRQMRSKTFIGHIRRSSVGRKIHANTHPFTRFFNGSEWTFAHNGTLPDYPAEKRGLSYHPIGTTDSEYAFCQLLSKMKSRKIHSRIKAKTRIFTRSQLSEIHRLLFEINISGGGPFNVIFSDSRYLFCYRDHQGERDLFYLKRQSPFNSISLRDQDYDINLNLSKNDSDTGYIVASDYLTDERWQSFAPAQLIVFKEGKIIANLKP